MVFAIFSILALATPAMAAQEEGFFFKSTQIGTAASANGVSASLIRPKRA